MEQGKVRARVRVGAASRWLGFVLGSWLWLGSGLEALGLLLRAHSDELTAHDLIQISVDITHLVGSRE